MDKLTDAEAAALCGAVAVLEGSFVRRTELLRQFRGLQAEHPDVFNRADAACRRALGSLVRIDGPREEISFA